MVSCTIHHLGGEIRVVRNPGAPILASEDVNLIVDAIDDDGDPITYKSFTISGGSVTNTSNGYYVAKGLTDGTTYSCEALVSDGFVDVTLTGSFTTNHKPTVSISSYLPKSNTSSSSYNANHQGTLKFTGTDVDEGDGSLTYKVMYKKKSASEYSVGANANGNTGVELQRTISLAETDQTYTSYYCKVIVIDRNGLEGESAEVEVFPFCPGHLACSGAMFCSGKLVPEYQTGGGEHQGIKNSGGSFADNLWWDKTGDYNDTTTNHANGCPKGGTGAGTLNHEPGEEVRLKHVECKNCNYTYTYPWCDGCWATYGQGGQYSNPGRHIAEPTIVPEHYENCPHGYGKDTPYGESHYYCYTHKIDLGQNPNCTQLDSSGPCTHNKTSRHNS